MTEPKADTPHASSRPDAGTESSARVYRRLLGYAMRDIPMFALALLGMVIYAMSDTAFAVLMKKVLDVGFIEQDRESMKTLPVFLVGIFIVRGLGSFFSSYCMNWVGRNVIKSLRREMFDKFMELPTAYFDRNSSGVLLSKLTFNIERVADATTRSVTVLVRDSLTILGLLAWMFYLEPVLSMMVIVLGPMIGMLVKFVSNRFRRYSTRIQDSMGDVTRYTEEVLKGHQIIKIFGGRDYENERFERVNEDNRRLHNRFVFVHAASLPVIQLIAGVGIAAVIFVAYGGFAIIAPLTAGEFVSFLGAMLLMMAPLKRLTDVNASIQQGIAAGHSIFQLIDEAPEPDPGMETLGAARGDIAYEDVSFSYESQKGPVLRGVSLAVRAGETVAIVGSSGSGKSTLVGMLPRFYDPAAGRILLDGKDVRSYRLADLRQQIALVSQDITLFNDSIRANIAYGSMHSVDSDAIQKAADAAHVSEFLAELPAGLDSMVGDRGVLLSGGQRQRIAIARALLKNAPILILDEATSALDSESERHIKNALETLMRNRTTLVIAHRLSTVEQADRILVLENGAVLESGDHASLLAANGRYAALYRLQFEEGA